MNASDIVADRLIERGVYLERYKPGFNKKILALLETLEEDLTKELVSAFARKVPNPSLRIQRLERLLADTRAIIKRAYSEKASLAGKELLRLSQNEQTYIVGTMNEVIGFDLAGSDIKLNPAIVGVTARQAASGVYERLLNYDELKKLVDGTLIEGAKSADWWARQSEDLTRRFSDNVRSGVLRGDTLDQLVARVRGTQAKLYTDGVMQTTRRQAEALVRTSVQAIANSTRLATFDANSDLITALQWNSTLDSRTTLICIGLNGKCWEAGTYRPIGHSTPFPGPTAHWNCFTGETPVESPSGARRLYRRSYTGELVTLETTNGRRITATPNHPVLTPTGWRAVGQIDVGYDLICKKGSGSSATTIPDDKCRVTTFSELADATAKLAGVFSVKMPVSRPDFHGDGTDGDVGEVWSYRKLSRKGNAALSKLLGNRDLKFGNLDRSDALSRCRRAYQRFGICFASACSFVRGLGVRLFSTRPSSIELLTSRSGNAGINTPMAKRGERDIKLPSDFAGSHLIGDIERDRVCVVRRSKAVSVLVHNLETDTGWYFADGIASHNCRSNQICVIKKWSELVAAQDPGALDAEFKRQLKKQGFSDDEIATIKRNTRASVDGQVSADLTFDQWLDKKAPAFQDELLGKGRAKLFRDGKITLPDLIDQSGRPLTIEELEKLSQPRPRVRPPKL